MEIPTIEQFNNWSPKDRLFWINFETAGKYRKYKMTKGYFPFIIYEKENVGIVYKVNSAGKIAEAVAMTVSEALDKLRRFEAATKNKISAN